MTTRTTGRPPLRSATTLVFLWICVMLFQCPMLTGAEVDENRTEQIAALLSEKPAGFGLPIGDRRAWKKSAYDVPQLSKLERTFVYCRSGAGSLTVTDEVVFSQACAFGTALVTFDKWRKLSDSSLMIYDQQEALHVDIAVSGAAFEIKSETIEEDLSGGRLPTRLGINLSGPVTRAVVSVTIDPAATR